MRCELSVTFLGGQRPAEDLPGGGSWCSSSLSLLSWLVYAKFTEQDMLTSINKRGTQRGRSLCPDLLPGKQETLREAGTEGQEEVEEEAHREQEEH